MRTAEPGKDPQCSREDGCSLCRCRFLSSHTCLRKWPCFLPVLQQVRQRWWEAASWSTSSGVPSQEAGSCSDLGMAPKGHKPRSKATHPSLPFPRSSQGISNSRVGCSHILSAPWAVAEKGVHPEASTPEESLQIGISLHNFHNSVNANQLFTTSLHHKLRDCHCLAR